MVYKKKKKQRKRFIIYITLLFEENQKQKMQAKNRFLIDLQIKTKMYAK